MCAQRSSEWPYSLQFTTPPVVEPVTLTEVRSHTRNELPNDDTQLLNLIKRARRRCEKYLDRQFINATYTLTSSCFPWATATNPYGSIYLPKAPLSSVTSITYTDTNNITATVSAATIYTVETPTDGQGKVHLRYQQIWPVTIEHPQAVTIVFVAGYGASGSSVPDTIKEAICAMVTFLNECRGDDPTESPKWIMEYLDCESWGVAL